MRVGFCRFVSCYRFLVHSFSSRAMGFSSSRRHTFISLAVRFGNAVRSTMPPASGNFLEKRYLRMSSIVMSFGRRRQQGLPCLLKTKTDLMQMLSVRGVLPAPGYTRQTAETASKQIGRWTEQETHHARFQCGSR